MQLHSYRSKRIAVVVTVLLVSAAIGTAPCHAQERIDDAEVRQAMLGFLNALNALDTDAMAGYFADDVAVFVPLVQSDLVIGKAAVVEIFRGFVERTKRTATRLRIAPEDLTVEASGDLGVVTFQARDHAVGKVSRRTFVFRRVGNQWLISHFHASDLAAG
jgi:ketosteroid isomerase-like protein